MGGWGWYCAGHGVQCAVNRHGSMGVRRYIPGCKASQVALLQLNARESCTKEEQASWPSTVQEDRQDLQQAGRSSNHWKSTRSALMRNMGKCPQSKDHMFENLKRGDSGLSHYMESYSILMPFLQQLSVKGPDVSCVLLPEQQAAQLKRDQIRTGWTLVCRWARSSMPSSRSARPMTSRSEFRISLVRLFRRFRRLWSGSIITYCDG